MNQINFLPDSYRHAQKRRLRTLQQAVLVALTAASCVAGAIGLKARSHAMSRNADNMEQTVRAEREALGAISEIEKQHASLMKRAKLQKTLMPPVSYHRVIAALSGTLSPDIAIKELVMTSVRPKPEPAKTPAQRKANHKHKTESEPSTAKKQPHVIGVELQGLAPDDLAVAGLVAALDGHALFSRVTMRSSQTVTVRGLRARAFNVTATIDLDREFDWVSPSPEVARAD